MQFGNLKTLAYPVAPRASFGRATSGSDLLTAVYLQETHGNRSAGEKLNFDFLLALAGFMVMAGEISGFVNL